jgi:hypothetical protein
MPISHDYERVPGPQGKAGRTTARLLAAVLAAAAALPAGAGAQIVTLPSGNAPGYAIGYGAAGDSYVSVDPAHPLPVGDRQEAFALVSANAPAAPQTVFGGDYILAQSCAAYGTLALQVRGPDGATFQTIISKTASDSTGGTGLALGSLAVVQAVASGTTGCNVTLSRVP